MVMHYYITSSRELRFGGICEWIPIEISVPHALENATIALGEHLQVSHSLLTSWSKSTGADASI